jgi:hypothetical protein
MKKSLLIVLIVTGIIALGGFAVFTYACYDSVDGRYACYINRGELLKGCGGYVTYPGEKCRQQNSTYVDLSVDLKPVIYLYPQQETEVTVKLDYHGKLIADYPEYDEEIGGWKVVARADGSLINLADGKEYSYLFWEGSSEEEINYDWTKGWIVKGSETREFLQDKLREIGLTPKEYNEFIVYWYPKMKDNNYNLIHFATPDEYDVYAPLTITPTPDNVLRVFMVFRPISNPQTIVSPTPQVFPVFRRDGFSVVEWGGSER